MSRKDNFVMFYEVFRGLARYRARPKLLTF